MRNKEQSQPCLRHVGPLAERREGAQGCAVRKRCVITQSKCKPHSHFISLCFFPLSTAGGNKGWLYGSLWGAEWEPNHHMGNKCCHRPTAERLLHVIKMVTTAPLAPDPWKWVATSPPTQKGPCPATNRGPNSDSSIKKKQGVW